MNDRNNRSKKSIRALERGFTIVETLQNLERARLTDVATELEMPPSTAHAYLQTLVETGYVRRVEDQYTLSLRFLELGGYTRQGYRIHEVARSEVDKIARKTNEVASLGVEEGGERVLLYKSEGADSVYDNAPTGEYTHMHWSALGKALLSQFDKSTIEAIVEKHGLPKRTDQTITVVDDLFEELETIRTRGYSIENEERRTGIRSIAVPVTDENNVVAAISISGPKKRMDDAWIEHEGVPLLQNAANIIEVRYVHD